MVAATNREDAGLAEGSPAPRPVLAVGAVMVDLVCRVPRLPVSGDGVVVSGFGANLGGCAFNSAVAVLDAGVPCRLFAPVGRGLFANLVDERLRELGLPAFHPDGEGERPSAVNEGAPAWGAVSAPALARVSSAASGPAGAVKEAPAQGVPAEDAARAAGASGYDSGGCVCFVEPDGQRTMITLPGIERHFCDEWFSQLDSELDVRAADEAAAGGAAGAGGFADEGVAESAVADEGSADAADVVEGGVAAAEGIAPEEASAAGAGGSAAYGVDAGATFACALASGYEVGGAGGLSIVRFLERHPEIPLFFGPGPLINELSKSLIDRLNALHPLWHLNDQEALSYTGCATVEEAGPRIAADAGSLCVITAGPTGSYAFFPPQGAGTTGIGAIAGATEQAFAASATGACAQSGERGLDGSAKRTASGQAADAPLSIFAPSDAVPADRLVDTVGAGDTHLGALAAAFAKGASWEEALQAANEAAARVVQVPGGSLAGAR